MKAHRTDGVSLVFALIFLAVAGWWLLAQILDLALPAVGWFVAGALILVGVLGLFGALRSARSTPSETTPSEATPSEATPSETTPSETTTPETAPLATDLPGFEPPGDDRPGTAPADSADDRGPAADGTEPSHGLSTDRG